ncbi:MAG: GNAT family N-acetyltransferase [Bacillota bacterium]
MVNGLCLSIYKDEYYKDLISFELPSDQKRYTGLPTEVLEKSIKDMDRYPIVILKDNIPVGFFVLHKNSEYADIIRNSSAILLRGLSIDFKHQGNGYAKKAMNDLPQFVMDLFPEAKELFLAVNEKNIVAQQLYAKVGFLDLGYRKTGAQGLQILMHYRKN